MDGTSMLLTGFFACAVLGLVVYGIANRKRELTGPAQVVSHRMELGIGGGWYGDNWNRMVTFRLGDGTQLELYVTKEEYETLTDGEKGMLTWDKGILIHFDPDRE